MVNLLKEREDKVKVSLKKFSPDEAVVARVNFILDVSSSMKNLFYNGSMQDTVEKVFPIARVVDDDKVLGMSVFNTSHRKLKDIDLQNYKGYVPENIINKNLVGGCTHYSPFINYILKNTKSNDDMATFNIVLTDGQNFDIHETQDLILYSSDQKIYWMFIALGDGEFKNLKDLVKMKGRTNSNVGYVKIENLENVSDEKLYDLTFESFIEFLKNFKNSLKPVKNNQKRVENVQEYTDFDTGFDSVKVDSVLPILFTVIVLILVLMFIIFTMGESGYA